MTQKGLVIYADEAYVIVAVKQATACDGCHKKDGCTSCTSILEVRAHNDCGADFGDTVEVTVSTGRVILYAFVVFILPFLPAMVAYFAVDAAFGVQGLSIASAFCALLIFFLGIRLTLDRQAEQRCDRSASKILEKKSENR